MEYRGKVCVSVQLLNIHSSLYRQLVAVKIKQSLQAMFLSVTRFLLTRPFGHYLDIYIQNEVFLILALGK